jgi:hypothetical protein
MTLKQSLKPDQSLRQRQALAAQLELAQTLAEEAEIEQLTDLSDDEAPPALEPKETYELEDWGISEIALEGEAAETPFDQEWTGPLPRLGDFPRKAFPRVLFWIDSQFQVHHFLRRNLRPKGPSFAAQEALAQAIASHLRIHNNVRLAEAGDWQWLPAIGKIVPTKGPKKRATKTSFQPELANLAPDAQRAKLEARLKHDSRFLQSFALVLPSGDVVTPAALVHPAQEGKRVTRAVALRWMSQTPSELAGERWTEKDWKDFKKAQEAAARRVATEKQRGRP